MIRNTYLPGTSSRHLWHLFTLCALQEAKARAELVANTLNLNGFARIDAFMNVEDGSLFVIEVNTVPGMTPATVLFHQALAESPPIYPAEFLRMQVRFFFWSVFCPVGCCFISQITELILFEVLLEVQDLGRPLKCVGSGMVGHVAKIDEQPNALPVKNLWFASTLSQFCKNSVLSIRLPGYECQMKQIPLMQVLIALTPEEEEDELDEKTFMGGFLDDYSDGFAPAGSDFAPAGGGDPFDASFDTWANQSQASDSSEWLSSDPNTSFAP